MAKGIKSAIEVEWVNVTYRSVILIVVVLVLGLVGGGGYWLYAHKLAPRDRASSALSRAERAYLDADKLRDGESASDEILDNAKASLEDARQQFEESNFPDAMVAAIRSEALSERVLSLAKGGEEDESRARFYKIEGDVRIKRTGEFAWRRADQSMTLNVGDQIKTSSSSSASLIYFDGTVTTLQPSSLIEIRDLFEDPVTKVRRVREKLNWGEVQASTQKRNVGGSYHEVATEKVTARTEDAGEFRIAFSKNKKESTVDAFDGRIEVTTGSRKETLDSGERVTADAAGALGAKQGLPGVPRLLSPSDQRIFVFDGSEAEAVTLGWESVARSERYRLMISNGSLFTSPLYDAERGDTTAILDDVPPDTYYWRVAAISKKGVQGPFSAPRAFRVSAQQIRDRQDQEPPKLEIVEFVPIGQMVIVNGVTEPGATLWVDNNKVDVLDDGTFNAIVRLRREGVNELQILAQDTAGNESRANRTAYLETY